MSIKVSNENHHSDRKYFVAVAFVTKPLFFGINSS